MFIHILTLAFMRTLTRGLGPDPLSLAEFAAGESLASTSEPPPPRRRLTPIARRLGRTSGWGRLPRAPQSVGAEPESVEINWLLQLLLL